MPVERRWRGEIDVPLTEAGHEQAESLDAAIERAGGFDVVYHDWLSRSRETAQTICDTCVETHGPRPWRMGPNFEGWPITDWNLRWAEWYVRHPGVEPPAGESWGHWYRGWMDWLATFKDTDHIVGVVTHNRNIQAVIASPNGQFNEPLYNVVGPDYCTVYRWDGRQATRWLGERLQPGVYLIRHGETEFGT
jgi:broad specificity phosphatase PhoE